LETVAEGRRTNWGYSHYHIQNRTTKMAAASSMTGSIIASVSGGKDSTAVAIIAKKVADRSGADFRMVFE
jgi:tRNA(Ile)-lysidine synthase TilS/MesJ